MAGVWSRFFGSSVSTAVGFGMGSALGPALSPITQAVANDVWARYPDRPLPATIAANLVAQGKMERDTGATEARKQGFEGKQFDRMVTAQRTAPELVLLMEMWRRGFIDKAAVTDALERHGLEARWLEPLENLKTILAPPSDVIRWAVREAFNPPLAASLGYDQEFPADFGQYAEQLGIPLEDAHRHWIAHWELPSYEQAAEMLHRRIIDRPLFDDLLKAKDYPPPWRDRLAELAQRIPPISDLIRFSVREVYQDDTAAKYGYDDDYPAEFTRDAALHGMNAGRAKQYWRAHWRLPSVRQGYVMRWRDEIGDAELDDLLRIQDYPSYWRKRLMDTRFLVPGRVDLRRLFIAGKISRADVKAGYQRIGYDDDDAELLTQLAEALKNEAKTEGVGSHVNKAHSALWATTHRAYVNAIANKTDATRTFTMIGVPTADRQAILDAWDAERALNRKTLTPAQIKKAWAKATRNQTTGQPWTREDAISALRELGYSVNDANEFLDIPPTKSAPVKALTASQIRQAFTEGDANPATGAAWTQDEAIAALVALGYSPNDALTYLGLG